MYPQLIHFLFFLIFEQYLAWWTLKQCPTHLLFPLPENNSASQRIIVHPVAQITLKLFSTLFCPHPHPHLVPPHTHTGSRKPYGSHPLLSSTLLHPPSKSPPSLAQSRAVDSLLVMWPSPASHTFPMTGPQCWFQGIG